MQRNPTQRNGTGSPGLFCVARTRGAAVTMLAVMVILSGCAALTDSPATGTDSGTASPESGAPETYSYKRAFELLFEGRADRAEQMLEARLETHPDDEQARYVMRQIKASPEEYLGESSFEYEVLPGETLTVLSQRFLGTYRLFYILARYNNIDTPSLLRAGQVLRIPDGYADEAENDRAQPIPIELQETSLSRAPLDGGMSKSETDKMLAKYEGAEINALDVEEKVKLGSAYQQWVDAALARGDTGEAGNRLAEAERRAPAGGSWSGWLDDMKRRVAAETMYQEGVGLRKLEPAAAAQTFSRVLSFEPDHYGARTALDELRRDTVPQLHREAVILYRNQELEQAIDIWDQVLAINPGFEPAQGYRTRALELRRRLDELD